MICRRHSEFEKASLFRERRGVPGRCRNLGLAGSVRQLRQTVDNSEISEISKVPKVPKISTT